MNMNSNNSRISILIICIVFLLFVILFLHLGIFPKNHNNEVIIETMENANSSLNTDKYEDFCKIHDGSSHTLEESCNNLTAENCNKVSCCVHINGNKCVAGSKNGATYKTEKNGEKIDVDYYYYKNKCVGNCPK